MPRKKIDSCIRKYELLQTISVFSKFFTASTTNFLTDKPLFFESIFINFFSFLEHKNHKIILKLSVKTMIKT